MRPRLLTGLQKFQSCQTIGKPDFWFLQWTQTKVCTTKLGSLLGLTLSLTFQIVYRLNKNVKLFLIAKQLEKNVRRTTHSKSSDCLFLSNKMQCFMFAFFAVLLCKFPGALFICWDTSQSFRQKSHFYGKLFVEERSRHELLFGGKKFE